MRKFKAIVRYQMADILFSMSVFFIVFAVCFGLGWAIIAFAGEGGTPFKGMYLWMCVFLGLCGGISYSIDFKFALQCGVTRAQAYLSTALSFGVVALVFALVDQLLLAVLPLWGEQSIVALYGEGYGPGLLGFAWTLAFNLAIVFLSYAWGRLRSCWGFWRSASWRSCWCPPSSRWCRARPTLQGRFFSLRSGSRLRGSSWRTPSCCSPSSPCCRRSPPTC